MKSLILLMLSMTAFTAFLWVNEAHSWPLWEKLLGTAILTGFGAIFVAMLHQ